MSFGKYSKKEEVKEEEAPKKTAASTKKGSLEDKLKELDVSYSQFKGADELFRKRALKDNYQEVKNEYGWKYDQPIE